MADIIPSVPHKEVASPNHGGLRLRTLGAFIHSTRGGTSSPESEYIATVRFMARVNPTQAGTHFVVGHHEVTRMIHDAVICWNQTNDNDTHLGMEIVQQTPTTPYVEFQYVAAADISAKWAIAFGFPPVYVGRQTTVNVQVKGLIGHEDAYSGWSRGKTDPGKMWNWPHFMDLVHKRYKELTTVVTNQCPGQARIAEMTAKVEVADRKMQDILDWIETSLPILDAAAAKDPTGQLTESAKIIREYRDVLQDAKNVIWNNGVAYPRQTHGLP